jgi:hypothetical protein
MPIGPDTYTSMTALYEDPGNVAGTTYAKRWKRHEWSQTVEEQPADNVETQVIVMAIHGGGIEKGTSEIALATAGYHPSTLISALDGHALHDFWLFEGLLPSGERRASGHVRCRPGPLRTPIQWFLRCDGLTR